MSYLGNTPTTQSFISGTDYFNGTGAQTAFTLSRTVASVNDIEAVVNNVVQQPNDAYTISGTTITFTSAPSAGTNNVYVRYLSTTTQAITPSQNTVSWNTLNSDVQQDLGISFKNRIINGNMAIDQRNAGASVTQTTADLFAVDRFRMIGTVTSKFTGQRSTTVPAGFVNSLLITSSSAYSVGASERFIVGQYIEGLNCYDLGWGTANAKTVTLSFWVRSSLTGTFTVAFRNGAGDRSYVGTYTINSANTFEYKSITVTGDTTGTWAKDTDVGINVAFNLGSGSSLNTTAGAWTAGSYFGTSGQVNVVGTNGATFYITGVQLEVGTQATTFTTAGGSYGAELALCQRYYEVLGYGCIAMAESGSTYVMNLPYRVTKRAAASIGLTITSNLRVRQFGVSDRDAATPVAGNVASSTTGGTFKVSGFASIGSASTPAGIGYTTTSEDGNAFFASAEL